MQELDLTTSDISRLQIKISAVKLLGFVLFFFELILLAILFIATLFMDHPEKGFERRLLIMSVYFTVPFILILLYAIYVYVDIKNGKKILIRSIDYTIGENNSRVFILLKDNDIRKIDISQKNMLKSIDEKRPLKIEISKISKTLLFISNGDENLLDKQL